MSFTPSWYGFIPFVP